MTFIAPAFSFALAASAILSAVLGSRARPAARDYLRFAAVLYLALALCDGLAFIFPDAAALIFADAVMLVVCALAPVALGFAVFAVFEHPPSPVAATIFLVAACLAGIAAAATGTPVLSFAPLAASVLTVFALCARRWRSGKHAASHAFLSACCLLCGAAATLGGGATGRTALELFSSAALLGFVLALVRRSNVPVAKKGDLRQAVPVGGSR
ncbi:MAG: hypothetical protein JSR55_00120 [Proteobacteria bacterium]|nr:hypothetical protein [Pseudomonadota bacterium]